MIGNGCFLGLPVALIPIYRAFFAPYRDWLRVSFLCVMIARTNKGGLSGSLQTNRPFTE